MTSPRVDRRRFLTLGALATLAACAKPEPPIPSFAEIGFQGQPQITFKVAAIDVIQEYRPPLTLPNVEHIFPVPPAQMAAAWARDRLRASAGTSTGRYLIKRASVVETLLPLSTGISAAFKKEQARRYDADLEVEFQIVNDQGGIDGTVSVRVTRRQTVGEDASRAEIQQAWYDMTKAMGNELGGQLSGLIAAKLSRFLTVSQ